MLIGAGVAALVLIVVLVVVLGGGGGDDGDAADVASDPVATTAAEPTDESIDDGGPPAGGALMTETPGSTRYGDVLWAITGASGTDDGARVEVELENQLDETELTIDPALELVATLADGNELRSTEIDGDTTLPAGGTLTTAYLFRDLPEGTTFDGATFSLTTGSQVEATFTPDDFADPPAVDLGEFTESPDGVEWQIGLVRVDYDALADSGTGGGSEVSVRRAEVGFAWVAIDVAPFAEDRDIQVSDNFVILSVDGQAVGPWTEFEETVPAGETVEIELGFSIPLDASTFELSLATVDGEAATIELDIRSLLDQLEA